MALLFILETARSQDLICSCKDGPDASEELGPVVLEHGKKR